MAKTPFSFKTVPRRHQLLAYEKARDLPHFAYLMAPGTGKTKTLLDDAAYNFVRGRIDALMVFADNGVHRQWIEEQVPLHLAVEHVAGVWRSGTVNKGLKAAIEKTTPKKLGVYAFNTELLSLPSSTAYLAGVLRQRRCMIAIDESQRIKAAGSKRTKNAIKLGELAALRRILTGSDVTRGYEDLYGQFRFLSWRILGAPTYTEFKRLFCVTQQAPGGESHQEFVVGYRNLPELQARIAPYSFLMEKKDDGDLPPTQDIQRFVEWTPEQARVYEQLVATMLAEVNTQIVDAQGAMQLIQRLQLVNTGYVRLPDGTLHDLGTHRVQALLDILEVERGKVIVWGAWQVDVERIMAALAAAGIRAVSYYGGNSDTVNAASKQAFQQDPTVRVFVATMAKGGRGLNLQVSSTSVYYAHTTDYEAYDQSRSRNHRDGSKHKVTYYHLVTPRSVDMRLLALHARKAKLVTEFHDPQMFKQWLLNP